MDKHKLTPRLASRLTSWVLSILLMATALPVTTFAETPAGTGDPGNLLQGEILFPFNEGTGSTSTALSDGLTTTLNNYVWDVDNGRGGTPAISSDNRGASGLTINYGAQFASVNDLTMGVWVKPAAPSAGTTSSLMAPPYAGTHGDWGFSNGEIWWSINWGTEANNYADTSISFLSYGSDGSEWDGGFSATAGNLADGEWHYLAFSCSTTAKTIKLYLDGKIIGDKNYTSLNPVNLQAYKWFGGNGYQGRAYTGLMDELSVFPLVLDDAAQEALYSRVPNTSGTGQQPDPADTDQVGDKTYHVAKNGSDSNPGTEAEPFLTIQKAAGVLLPGETVILHEGVYEESVRPKYNGTADHPITYKTADGEKAVISGADLITGEWQTASNPTAAEYNADDANLWKVGVSLPMGNYRNQVFVDGEAMLPSRYPNVAKDDAYYRPNWLTYKFDGANASVGGWSSSTGKLNDPGLNQPAGTWDGASIVGMDNRGWCLSGAEVVSSTPGWLNLTNINFYELGPTGYASGDNFPYYIQNAMAALDASYEWFYDQNSETLYLQLPNGENPNGRVRYKAREWGLDLSSRKYIHMEGIDLNGCNMTMRNGVGNVVDKMTAKYVTDHMSPSNERGGIIVGGSNNTLINSEIAYSSGALVTVEGEGNKIVNCKLHDATTGPNLFTFSITISGINHLISRNEVYNASGTLVGGSFYACEISYNNIYDGNWHSTDCGLIYLAYSDYGNSQIHHNKIHDSHSDFSNGVYFDLGCKNALVYNNVLWNLPWTSVFVNSSSEFISVVNNTVYQGASNHDNPEIYTNSPGYAYMDVFVNNLVDSRGVGTDNVNAGAVVQDNYSRPNDDIDGTATFTNPPAFDFTLKSGSGAVGAGIVVEGLVTTPNAGAYQPGDAWNAGLKDTPVTVGDVSAGPQLLPYADRNLLFNSGFEWPRVSFTGMGTLPYWQKSGIGSTSLVQASSSADNAHAREQYSVELTGQNIGIEQTITGLEPGKDYVLRGFGRMGSGSSADGQKVEIGVRVGENTFNGKLDRPAWRSVSIKFTADQTGTATVYATKTTAGSKALVDDFSVARADLVPNLEPGSDDLYPMLNSPVALLDDMLFNDSQWTVTNQSSFAKDEPSGLTLEAQPGQSAAAFYTREKYGNKDFYLKLGEDENLDALDLTVILRANAATQTANRYEIAIHGTTATLTRYYSGTATQLDQWTVDINDRLLKAGAVWEDNGSGYGIVTVTLKSGNNTLFTCQDENNLNISAAGYFGLATDSSIKLGRVTEYVDMGPVIADKGNWKSNSSISWEDNDARLTPVGSATAGYTGRTFGDAEFVVGFESGLNTGAFPCFILRAPTQQDLLDNPWSGAKYSVIIKEGSFEIQHWPEVWKPGASILSADGRSVLADNKGFVLPYKDTLVKVSTVNTDNGVWIRLKAGDTIVASWIDENNYIPDDGYFGVCGYTEPMSVSVPNDSTYVPVIGDPDANPGGTVDITALEKLISDAEALVETEYTPASWAVLETALDNAKAVLANQAATQAQVDAAVTALQAEITGLVQADTETPPPTVNHTITASAGNHGTISPSGATAIAEGTGKTFTFTPSSGYKVENVWVDGSIATVSGNSYTFTNVTGSHTIYVTFSQNNSGNSTPAPTTPAPTTPAPTTSAPTTSAPTPTPTHTPTPAPTPTPSAAAAPIKVEVPAPVVDAGKGEATVAVDKAALDKALEKSSVVLVEIPQIKGVESYVATLPPTALTSGNAEQKIQIATSLGTVMVPGNLLNNGQVNNSQNVGITIARADTSSFDSKLKAEIGDRPVIELLLTVDGEQKSWNNPKAAVTVSVPYAPGAAELADPEHIVVWYVDGEGKVTSVPTGKYDPATGMVTFTTTHFSKYAVTYVKKTFSDIAGYAWAKKEIEVSASKGVINGTSATTFMPSAAITRADFIVLLVKALGLSTDVDSNFADISPTAYYADAVGIARQLGITNGVGNNKFDPKANISRQDMMTFIYRAMAAANKNLTEGTSADLEKFADKMKVGSYAVQSVATLVKNGIVSGDGANINPLGNATRVETAVLIYRIYNK